MGGYPSKSWIVARTPRCGNRSKLANEAIISELPQYALVAEGLRQKSKI